MDKHVLYELDFRHFTYDDFIRARELLDSCAYTGAIITMDPRKPQGILTEQDLEWLRQQLPPFSVSKVPLS